MDMNLTMLGHDYNLRQKWGIMCSKAREQLLDLKMKHVAVLQKRT